MTDASDRTRRIRSLIEFQAKVAGAPLPQSSEFVTSATYGAIVSQESGCCNSPTNYAAYFRVQEPATRGTSAFNIAAESPFTIEWWQTDVSANEFQSRNIFAFGTFVFSPPGTGPEFSCVLTEGSIITRIAGVNYPPSPTSIDYGTWESMLVPNHFAMVRAAGAGTTIRIYKNGYFLGEFAYDGAISITNTGETQLTIRNQTVACAQAQMYGDLPSFRWTARELYTGFNYGPPDPTNFSVPAIPLQPLANNVFTINTFPTSGSITTPEGFTVTHYTPDTLPACQ